MHLRRRRVLAAAATTGALAGCMDGQFADEGGTPTPRQASTVGCPPYERDDVERVICSSDHPDDALVFRPETDRVELPRAELVCRFENDREEPFSTNFYDTTLHGYDGEEWWFLGPYVVPQPLHRLSAGETHVRRLLVDNTDLRRVRPPSPDGGDDEWTTGRHGLGPGTYALAIESESEGMSTRYAAAFTLRGDSPSLVAPETVTGTERDGDRRTVRVEPMLNPDVDRYTLVVRRRADPPRSPEPLVDEQLYHPTFVGLRAALAHVETDVTTVEVRGDDSQFTRNLTGGRGPDFIEYDGATFELRVDTYDG